jgi:hypothetical protein
MDGTTSRTRQVADALVQDRDRLRELNGRLASLRRANLAATLGSMLRGPAKIATDAAQAALMVEEETMRSVTEALAQRISTREQELDRLRAEHGRLERDLSANASRMRDLACVV